jgi:KUP system potassium uptake protein
VAAQDDAPAMPDSIPPRTTPADAANDAAKPAPALTLAAIGVVFGDIGTNPLYAIRQVFHDTPDFARDPAAIIGIVSLFLWSILLVVCVKYAGFVLRADHDGEGGTLALLGKLHAREPYLPYRMPSALTLLVLFGSGLLFGDGMVTPAISVLSAVEGLEVATDAFKPYVVPLAVAILVALFLVQSRGTARIGRAFGPVMLVWFATIGAVGAASVLHHPAILAALDPRPGLVFLFSRGWLGYATLGSVVLAFAGVEALFADLGHFGRRPILLGWYSVVLPGLLLNYFGQGALLLTDPAASREPFYGLVAPWALYPMVLLATAATVIASQALISGIFSLTQQAVNMGYAPRYAIRHTSAEERGQVYMPVINAFLAIGCIGIVLGFRSSDALGAAYGLAVIGTMTITSVVFYLVTRRIWRWSRWAAMPLVGGFLLIELAFLGANLAKLLSGAWVPLAIGIFVFAVMATWTIGRARYWRALRAWAMPIEAFRAMMRGWTRRDAGIAVFLSHERDFVPLVGKHEWMRAHVAHERVVLLKVVTMRRPYARSSRRVAVEDLGDGLYRVTACFGFMETPDLPAAVAKALPFAWEGVAFYLADPQVAEGGPWHTQAWRRLFLFLGRTGLTPIAYFSIPPHMAISVGLELEI